MNPSVPAYLLPYLLIGNIGAIVAVLAILNVTLKLTNLSVQRQNRAFWTGFVLIVGWYLAAFSLSRLGVYQGVPSRVPTIQWGLLTPILAGIAMFRWWPAFRNIVESVPQKWLVTAQVYRALGLIFLLLYATGKLPGPFALPAGIGDVTVGVLAPFVGASTLKRWNLLGLADLGVALTTGMLTSPSPIQLLAFDHPNTLISAFPLVMIPVFAVPLSILLHLASLAKLRNPQPTPISNATKFGGPLPNSDSHGGGLCRQAPVRARTEPAVAATASIHPR